MMIVVISTDKTRIDTQFDLLENQISFNIAVYTLRL